MKVELIRASGAREQHELPNASRLAIRQIAEILSAEALATVNLRDGRVMLVDDAGFIDSKPRNFEATKLYHSVCVPGTTHPICGDVAIVRDEDFA